MHLAFSSHLQQHQSEKNTLAALSISRPLTVVLNGGSVHMSTNGNSQQEPVLVLSGGNRLHYQPADVLAVTVQPSCKPTKGLRVDGLILHAYL